MSNVVTKNDELLKELLHANREIDHLRNVFLDPFARKKKKEIEMHGKPSAIEPKSKDMFVAHGKQVQMEEDNIIRPDRETLISKNMNAT